MEGQERHEHQTLAKAYLAYCDEWAKNPTIETWKKHGSWKSILMKLSDALFRVGHPDAKSFSPNALGLINGYGARLDSQMDEYVRDCCRCLQKGPLERFPAPSDIDFSDFSDTEESDESC